MSFVSVIGRSLRGREFHHDFRFFFFGFGVDVAAGSNAATPLRPVTRKHPSRVRRRRVGTGRWFLSARAATTARPQSARPSLPWQTRRSLFFVSAGPSRSATAPADSASRPSFANNYGETRGILSFIRVAFPIGKRPFADHYAKRPFACQGGFRIIGANLFLYFPFATDE
jgi:hypothetical protein